MAAAAGAENRIVFNKHILLCVDYENPDNIKEILEQFCGLVFFDIKQFDEHVIQPDTDIYICGNILKIFQTSINIINRPTQIISEISYNHEKIQIKKEINIGLVPLNIHNAGIYFKQFFNPNKDYFAHITGEHAFQTLTESNKGDVALRKGIYLSKVTQQKDDYRFNLLRCSTNLKGPTENFRDTDNEIMNSVNEMVRKYFDQPVKLNHVLAQVYENSFHNEKERKAKISTHSDKTKDMPRNGLIAFCTFYKGYNIKHVGDVQHKNQTIFTKLRFKLKNNVENMCPMFEIVLYPNSVFIIPLSINRLYTHEISPSILPIEKIPVRCGFIARCSNQEAVHRHGITYIEHNHDLVLLEQPDEKDFKHLKDLYVQENATTNVINYGQINFSLNQGDYMQPKL
jgi:hypothetical protein